MKLLLKVESNVALGWALAIVNGILQSREAFTTIFLPFLNLDPKGGNIGMTLFKQSKNIGLVFVGVARMDKGVRMESFTGGGGAAPPIINLSTQFYGELSALHMSFDQMATAKFTCLVALLRQCARVLMPTLKMRTTQDQYSGEQSRLDCKYWFEFSHFKAIIGNVTSEVERFDNLVLVQVLNPAEEAVGENLLRKRIPMANVHTLIRALDRWNFFQGSCFFWWYWVTFPVDVLKTQVNYESLDGELVPAPVPAEPSLGMLFNNSVDLVRPHAPRPMMREVGHPLFDPTGVVKY